MKDPLDDAPPVETKKAVTGIVVVLVGVALLVLARPSAWVTISIVIGLVLTIMLHEAGHMVMAKRSGMKVTEFFVGFGPRIWSFRKGETEYGIKAIPAGGYVRIIGMSNVEEVDPEDEARTYRRASTSKKLKTILAGVTVNLLIAYILFFVVIVGNGEFKPGTSIDQIQKSSPAAAAGLKAGDKIVAINGVKIKNWDDLGANVRPNANRQIEVTALRHGQTITVTAIPEKVAGDGKLGVYPSSVRQTYSPIEAVPQSFRWMGRATAATVGGLAKVFSTVGRREVRQDGDRTGFEGLVQQRAASPFDRGHRRGRREHRGRQRLGAPRPAGHDQPVPRPLQPHPAAALRRWPRGSGDLRVLRLASTGRSVQVDYKRLMPITAAVLVVVLALGLSTMYLDVRQIITGT